MTEFQISARGPFSLAAAQDFAGGFTPGIGGGAVGEGSIAMSFPLEGSDSSAAVELSQRADGVIVGRTDAADSLLPDVIRHAARSLSLDHDGSGWPAVGERDAVIGRLQQHYRFLRPVCFYSAYEAATSFVIGQRISRSQGARVKEWLRDQFGDHPTVDGHAHPAFPRPEVLLEISEIKGVSEAKIGWLHGLAQAALDGRLDSDALRALPREGRWPGCASCPV
jgi:DNA-3-methyladenine glycosylase II